MTNELFTLVRIIDVNDKNHTDCDVLTSVALSPLGNDLGNYPNSLFKHLSENAVI